jgi:hypothetical protein
MEAAERAVSHLRSRPAAELIGRRDRLAHIFEFLPDREVFVFGIRSITGDTYTVELDGYPFIFLDDVATEYALHLYDFVFAADAGCELLQKVSQGIQHKQLARALFAVGDTVEAFVIAVLEKDPVVTLSDAQTPLTQGVDTQRRRRFVNHFEAFTLGHELAHEALSRDEKLNDEYRGTAAQVLVAEQKLFEPSKLSRISEATGFGVDPATVQMFEQFAASGVYPAYESLTTADLLGDEEFVEELSCDLLATETLLQSFAASDKLEVAEHILLAAFATFFSRSRALELSVIEFIRDALRRTELNTPLAAILKELDARGGQYTDGDDDRYRLVQRFRIRLLALASYLEELLINAGVEAQSVRTSFDSMTVSMANVIGLLVGPIETWSFKLHAVAYLAAAEMMGEQRAKGLTDGDVLRSVREMFLERNKIDPAT